MAIELTLDIDAIKDAIKAYIETQGIKTEGKNVDITILNGRGATKNRAQITISDVDKIIAPPGLGVGVNVTTKPSQVDLEKMIEEDKNTESEKEPEFDISENAGQGEVGNDSLFPEINPDDAPKPEALFI